MYLLKFLGILPTEGRYENSGTIQIEWADTPSPSRHKERMALDRLCVSKISRQLAGIPNASSEVRRSCPHWEHVRFSIHVLLNNQLRRLRERSQLFCVCLKLRKRGFDRRWLRATCGSAVCLLSVTTMFLFRTCIACELSRINLRSITYFCAHQIIRYGVWLQDLIDTTTAFYSCWVAHLPFIFSSQLLSFGAQPRSGISNEDSVNPGATVVPTSVQLPRLWALCHCPFAMITWGAWSWKLLVPSSCCWFTVPLFHDIYSLNSARA